MNWWKIGGIIAIAVILFLGGFFIGRKSVKPEIVTETKVEYIEGKTICDTIYKPKPYKVVEPIDTLDILKQCIADGMYYELFPEKIKDSIIYITRRDSTSLLADYTTKRYYEEELFNSDTLGRCVFNSEVQYNRLKVIGYEYTPITKREKETNQVIKKYSPYVGLGISIYPAASLAVGCFYEEKWGMSLEGSYHIKQYEGAPKFDIGLKVLRKF